MADVRCESCGMPVPVGPYCRHCTDEQGALQSFEDRLRGMTEFILGQSADLTRDAAEVRARAYMRTMPAWRDRPELAE